MVGRGLQARRLRDDKTFYQAQAMHADSIAKTVHRILSSTETDWSEKQRDLRSDRIKAKQ